MNENLINLNVLAESVTSLQGISTKREVQLEKLEIRTVGDLATHFPRRYEDWTQIKDIIDLESEEDGVFLARIDNPPTLFRRGKRSMLNLTVRDDTAAIKIVWFNQPYYQNQLVAGNIYLFRGKIKRNGLKFETANPKFEKTNLTSFPKTEDEWDEVIKDAFIEPVYPSTAGVTQNNLRKWTQGALAEVNEVLVDYLSPELRREYSLAELLWSLKQIHTPDNEENYDLAKRRLSFDELLLLQLNMKMSKAEGAKKPGEAISLDNNPHVGKLQAIIDSLAFELTNDQKDTLKDVLLDMSKKSAMNRLVQGDVGSGKTIVSFLAMIWAGFNGYQSVLMAPTGILAQQHYASFKKFFPDFNEDELAILTGDNTAKEKQEIYARVKSGEIKYLIGTHAVIQDKLVFNNLALAVTDEQHRFGVKQRVQLASGTTAHILVMSATPIPRTLGLLLYGDLDISLIKEKPANRKEIKTYTARTRDKNRLIDIMKRNALSGSQSYVVCPTVETSENLDLASVTQVHAELQAALPELNVGILHGQMKDQDKNRIMDEFLSGEINILVSTTVIEVGVDNPNATFMLIVNAERFGLAELHQLRGRIGRGSKESICVLLSDVGEGKARDRLITLCKNSDGFDIAEADLQLRGPGDIFGTRQHGVPSLKLANLYEDTELITITAEVSSKILAKDPYLKSVENRVLSAIMDIYRRRIL